jgi:hypothetical protein
MHFVHTRMVTLRPFSTPLTRCRFGSHRRFVRTCEWLTLYPVSGPFPQIEQRLAIGNSPWF